MNKHFYFSCIRSTTESFLDLFNDISIMKYDSNNNPTKEVKVPIKFQTKEKFLYWLKDKKQTKYFLMMSVNLVGMSYNQERQTGRMETLKLRSDDIKLYNPTPYLLDFSLNIATIYLVEAEQILEQILPYFSPHVMMKVYLKELNFAFDSSVILGGVTYDVSTDIPEEDFRIVNLNIDFSVATFLFKPIEDIKLINKVLFPIHSNKINIKESSEIILTDEVNEDGDKIYDKGDSLIGLDEIFGIKAEIDDELNKKLLSYEIYKDI